jgi:shikimate 5-dehydrogenase/shikimate kinase
MHTLIVGHRGTGKTLLLQRLKRYFPDGVCICLDQEIEKSHGAISTIFKDKGEAYFRKLEIDKFTSLLPSFKQKIRPVFIALGAGFEGALPADWEVVYLQRDVPVQNFLFPDRPNLGNDGLQMPSEKFSARSAHYLKMATQELILREGEVLEIPEEKEFFTETINSGDENGLKDLGGILTLLPYQVQAPEFKFWARNRRLWGVEAFEIRDDLLSSDEIKKVIASIPKENLILSFREKSRVEESIEVAASVNRVDWPLEYGGEVAKSIKDKVFYSLHSTEADFDKHLKVLEENKNAVKWSPFVSTLAQLRKGDAWQKKNPDRRSFLPRSANGRWAWYRLLTKGHMPIQFFREGTGSSADQPTLLQWSARGTTKKFAAILGSPVRHSWTPLFHQEFFRTRNVDVLALDLSEAELDRHGFSFLDDLGFRAFAVTSPLKSWAGKKVKADTPLNTLVWQQKHLRWQGFNTDPDGFKKLVEDLLPIDPDGSKTAVWGGGGVLDSLKAVLPKASYYCTRKGQPREGQVAITDPQFLVWCAGSKKSEFSPPANWKPKVVFDLSYTSDSLGIAYAERVGAKYVSGKSMFVAQALKQQEIWSRYEF